VQIRKASNQTLQSFGVEYVQKYARVELAAATQATNRVLWNRYILPRLGKRQLILLAHQPEIVQEFKAELVVDGVGDPTIKRTLAVLSGVLGKAVEWNRIPTNPVSTVRKPSARRRRVIRPLAPKAIEHLRVVMPSEADKKLVSVLAYDGLRLGEALALEGTDVATKTISMTRALKLDGLGDTKTHKARLVSLLAALADDLKGVQAGLVFPATMANRGRPPRTATGVSESGSPPARQSASARSQRRRSTARPNAPTPEPCPTTFATASHR
jgi:integrase